MIEKPRPGADRAVRRKERVYMLLPQLTDILHPDFTTLSKNLQYIIDVQGLAEYIEYDTTGNSGFSLDTTAGACSFERSEYCL